MCELSARITPGGPDCVKRRSAASPSCRACEHVRPVVAEEVVVPTVVAKPRKAKKSVDLPTGPVLKAAVVYPDLDADAADVLAGFGRVKNASGDFALFGACDPLLLEFVERMLICVKGRLLVDVSGLPFDVAAAHVLHTVEGMARRSAP